MGVPLLLLAEGDMVRFDHFHLTYLLNLSNLECLLRLISIQFSSRKPLTRSINRLAYLPPPAYSCYLRNHIYDYSHSFIIAKIVFGTKYLFGNRYMAPKRTTNKSQNVFLASFFHFINMNMSPFSNNIEGTICMKRLIIDFHLIQKSASTAHTSPCSWFPFLTQ